MTSLKQFINDYLNFTNREKYGIAGLLILMALFYFLPFWLIKEKDYSKEIHSLKSQLAQLDSINNEVPSDKKKDKVKENATVFEPFNFDPNTIEPQKLEKFGISQIIINRFIKFRNAGAKFYSKADFKKLYGLEPALFNKIEPYIVIEKKEFQSSKEPRKDNFSRKQSEIIKVELNEADSAQLLAISGIGPYICSKIIKYRNALGGFISIDQLKEIYGIKPEQFDVIKPYIFVNPLAIKRLNVNRADYNELNKHPYISSKQANAIIQYRKQHGVYSSVNDLKKIHLMEDEMLIKLELYIEF